MPYTPTNNPYAAGDPYMYDLKWLVDKVKEWKDPADSADRAEAAELAAKGYADNSNASSIQASNYANDASESADAAQASEEAAAEYVRNIGDPVNGIVTDWLNDNVTPVGSAVVVDSSLSIAGAAADAKTVGDNAALYRGTLGALGITTLNQCKQAGWYSWGSTDAPNITDLPADYVGGAGCLIVCRPAAANSRFSFQTLHAYAAIGQISWTRTQEYNSYGTPTTSGAWIKNETSTSASFIYRGLLDVLAITALSDCRDAGWYGWKTSYAASITDLPSNVNIAGTLYVYSPSYAGAFIEQKIETVDGKYYRRLLRSDGTIYIDWTDENTIADLLDKNVAIIGDSISTSGDWSNVNPTGNVCEIVIENADVGVPLSAFPTYYDIGITVGGHTITTSDIGHELNFTPVAGDVGKVIGRPLTYNNANLKNWWKVAQEFYRFNVINVSWSGSSITSHESGEIDHVNSFAWHDATIRKCGIRVAGSMTRTAPDVIIICRGINDFSHPPYAGFSNDFFDGSNWTYPNGDYINNQYDLKAGLTLTIKKLRETYPNARIMLCTLNTFKRVNYSHFPTNNGINTLPQYNAAIREVAEYMGCDVINFDKDGITFENCVSGGYSNDGTHPTALGHRLIGKKAIVDINSALNL